MAKSQDVLALARAALENNRDHAINVCKCIVGNEPDNSTLKGSLKRLLSGAQSTLAFQEMVPRDLKGFVLSIDPALSLDDTELPATVVEELGLFLEEQRHADSIHDVGLQVPHKILLAGPPGNGKTTLAGAIAKALDRPFFVMDFSRVIASHLGETGANIAKVFRGVVEKPSILFIDEMETVLGERAGSEKFTEVGEIKRLVSTLLMEVDRLPDHVLLIGATNHEEMLDRAVVRRFDFHWHLPAPEESMVESWLRRFAARYPDIPVLAEMPVIEANGRSLSDIDREAKRWCRRWVVGQSVKRNRLAGQATPEIC